MRVSRVINGTLLGIIKEHGTIDYNTLRRIYIKPTPPGVVTSDMLMDDDLKVLEEEGYIKIENRFITIIKDF